MPLINDARHEISEILERRANEVAMFKAQYIEDHNHLGSVELALSREINRLRDLADWVSREEENNDAKDND